MASPGNLALGNAMSGGDTQPNALDPMAALQLMAPGLIGPDGKIDIEGYRQQRMYQGLMGLASGLLSKSGPSTTPVGFGQALGAGLEGMQASQQGYDRSALNGAATAQAFANIGKLSAEQKYLQAQTGMASKLNQPLPPMYSSGNNPGIGPTDGPGSSGAGGSIDFPTARQLAQKAGFQGDAADKIAAISLAESSGDPFAKNEKGEHSYGITQINADAHGPVAREAYGNPLRAMQLAYDVSKGGSDFTPWSMYKNGQYQKYLPASEINGSSTAPVAGDTQADLQRKDRLRQQDPYLGLGPSGMGMPAPPAPQSAAPVSLPPSVTRNAQMAQMPDPNANGQVNPAFISALKDRQTAYTILGKTPPKWEADTWEMLPGNMKSPEYLAKVKAAETGAEEATRDPFLRGRQQQQSDLAARNNSLQQGMIINPQNPAAGVAGVPNYAQVNAANKGAEAEAQEGPKRISTGMEPRPVQSSGSIVYPPGSPGAAQFRNAQMQNQKLPDGTALNADGSVTVLGPSSNKEAFGKQIGEKTADELMTNYKTARDAAVSLENMKEARKLLDSGINTGPFSSWKQSFDRVLGDRGLASNTEAFVAAQARQVGQLIKQFGSGTGLSDADREYATKMAGGSIDLTEESIRKILDINERASTNAINRHNADAEKVPAGLSPYPLTVPIPDARPQQTQGSAGLNGVTSSGIKWSIK